MKKKIEIIYKSAALWKIIGRVFPLLFLGTLFLLYVIGFDDAVRKSIVVGGTIFFAIAIVWWWWAIDKIVFLVGIINNALDELKSVKESLTKFTKDFKNDTSDR